MAKENSTPESQKSSSRGLILDGVIATSDPDSSGERLDIKGCDTSTMEEEGYLNTEHRNPSDDDDSSGFNSIIGKCIKCKKIFKESDCEDDRQRFYWEQCRKEPFIYGRFRLFDEAGHPGAVAAAAIIRDQAQAGEPMLLRFSIEGSTLKKEGNILKESVCRAVALTARPCNRAAITGLLYDPKKDPAPPEEVEESTKLENPLRQKLGKSIPALYYQDDQTVTQELLAEKIRANLSKLQKALSAGNYNVAPGSLSGGAALCVEDPSLKQKRLLIKCKAAIRDWAGEGDLKPILKFHLPEASDEFLDHFTNLAEDWSVKKRGEWLSKAEQDLTKALPNPLQRYHQALQDPAKGGLYQKATRNWALVHQSLLRNAIPPALVEHAALVRALGGQAPDPFEAESVPLDPNHEVHLFGHGVAAQVLPEAAVFARKHLKSQGFDPKEHSGVPGTWAHYLADRNQHHKVFINQVQHLLEHEKVPHAGFQKSETDKLSQRCARVFTKLHNQFGPVPATLAYYAYIVPALLGSAQVVEKAERLTDQIYSALRGTSFDPDAPGYVPPPQKPTPPKIQATVSSSVHGLPGLAIHPEQQELIHGIDMAENSLPVTTMDPKSHPIHKGCIGFRRNQKGDLTFVKPNLEEDNDWLIKPGENPFTAAQREAAYYNLAKNFFGMHKYVPATAAFRHPTLDRHYSAQEIVNGSHWKGTGEQRAHLKALGLTGELDKMAAMDLILRHDDRHAYNWMMDHDGTPKLIDNGYSLGGDSGFMVPHYLRVYNDMLSPNSASMGFRNPESFAVHPEAAKFIMGLDPNQLKEQLNQLGAPLHPWTVLQKVQSRIRQKNPQTLTWGDLTAATYK